MAQAVPFFAAWVWKGCGKCKCDTGDFRITVESLKVESSTFKAYLNILDWLQTNYRNMFHFKNISDDYSIERIRMEIRTAKKKGCRVVAYDTLKSCGSTEWGELQKTATELSELIKR